MKLYHICDQTLEQLRDIMRRMPNRTREEHADVVRLNNIIDSAEQAEDTDCDGLYDDPHRTGTA